MTAAAVGVLDATATIVPVSINVTTVPLTRKVTLGTLATWLATVGFLASTITATAFAGNLTGNVTGVMVSGAAGAAVNAVSGTAAVGVDTAAGSLRIIANLSTGAAVPAGLTFQGGQVIASGATTQTAADMWKMRMGTTTGITELVAGQATARIVGGSTNGLAIRNSANTRDNFAVTDDGTVATLRSASLAGSLQLTVGAGELSAGILLSSGPAPQWAQLSGESGTGGVKLLYYDGTVRRSAVEVPVSAGFSTLSLMKSGGDTLHGALATYATTDVVGFLFLPTVAGAMTGVPTNATDKQSAMRFDTTNNKLWVYNHVSGAWKSIVLI
jgi:hypothetical protein